MCPWRRRHWAPEQVPRGGVWGEKGSKRLQKHVERCYGNPAWESSPQFCDGGGLAGASWNERFRGGNMAVGNVCSISCVWKQRGGRYDRLGSSAS